MMSFIANPICWIIIVLIAALFPHLLVAPALRVAGILWAFYTAARVKREEPSLTWLEVGTYFKGVTPPKNREVSKHTVTLVLSFVAALIGVFAVLMYDKSALGYQFLYQLPVSEQYNISLTFGVDGIAMLFVILTLYLFPSFIVCAISEAKFKIPTIVRLLVLVELLLILTFTTTNLLCFYIFFESILIPMFILIGVWGARARKIKAAYYFFLYTLFGSLFMLFGLIYCHLALGTMHYYEFLVLEFTEAQQVIFWFCLLVAFAVKMPLFPVHIWLPEAHVEAPTIGSMLLASLLLKLGGYGIFRFLLPLQYGTNLYLPLVAVFATLGVIYGSLATCVQTDLKRVIAYSSVAHMNLVMLGLISCNEQGVGGAILLMIGHAVVSSALFFCVGVLYSRHHSRQISYYSGVVSVMPLFTTFFLLFSLANMGFPGTSNFAGEILLLTGLFGDNSMLLVLATSGIVLSAAYSIWLQARVTFGTLKTQAISKFADLDVNEFLVLATYTVGMLSIGLSAAWVDGYTPAVELWIWTFVKQSFKNCCAFKCAAVVSVESAVASIRRVFRSTTTHLRAHFVEDRWPLPSRLGLVFLVGYALFLFLACNHTLWSLIIKHGSVLTLTVPGLVVLVLYAALSLAASTIFSTSRGFALYVGTSVYPCASFCSGGQRICSKPTDSHPV